MNNVKKYQSFKKPFNFTINDEFLDPNLITDFFRLNKSLFKKSVNVQVRLKNNKLSNKRNLLRVIEKNKLKIKSNKELIFFCKKMFRILKKNCDHSFLKNININKSLLKKGEFNLSFCWDKPGYYATPHTDTNRKIWSGIVYLFDDLKGNSGTTILKKNKGRYEKFKTIKPKINRLLAFKRSDKSHHSVEESNKKRIILLINFNFKKKFFK